MTNTPRKLTAASFKKRELISLSRIEIAINELSQRKQEFILATLTNLNDVLDTKEELEVFEACLAELLEHNEMRRISMCSFLQQTGALVEIATEAAEKVTAADVRAELQLRQGSDVSADGTARRHPNKGA
jgi:hypothetical protein